MKTGLIAAVAAALIAVASVPAARADDTAKPLEFNYGYPTVDHVNIYVAQDLGLFKKVGLKPHFYTFQSGAPLLAGLKSKSLDVVTAGLGLAFAIGQNIPLTYIFWTSNDAQGEGLVVDPKTGIKSFKDIQKASKIGAASGTCAQVALYLMAKKLGIDYGSLNVVNIPAPLFRNSFLSDSIDAGIAWAPYSFMLEKDNFKVVNWDPDYVPLGGICPRMTAVRPDFLKEHPDLGVKLLKVDAMAAAAVKKNPELAIKAIVKRLGLSPAVVKASLARVYDKRPTYKEQIDPNSPYSMTSKNGGLAGELMLASKVLAATGAIPKALDPDAIRNAIDPSYLQEYLKGSGSN